MARQLEQEIYDMESMSETHTMLRGEQKEQSRWSRTVLFGLGLLALTAVAVGAAVFSSNNRVSLHKSSDKVVQLSEDDVWSAVLSPNAMKQYEQEKAASKEVDKAEEVDKAAAAAALQREKAASKVEEAMKQAVSQAKNTVQQAEDKVSATFQAGADKAASAVQSAQSQAESAVKSAQSQAQSHVTQVQKDAAEAAQKMMQNLVGGDTKEAASNVKSAEDFGSSIQAAAKKAMGALSGATGGEKGPNWGSLLGGAKAPAPAAPAVPAVAPAPAAPKVPAVPTIAPLKIPAAPAVPAVPAAPAAPAVPAAAAAVVAPAAALPTTTTTTTDDPEESALAPEVAKNDKDPCSSDQELHGGLCYAKCATLTAGSHPCRSSAWSCCAVAAGPNCGEQAGLENCWVHPGFCFGYAVSGHDEDTEQGTNCPTAVGDCLNNEEMFMEQCYKKCSILTQGTHNYRTGAGTCCSKQSHFECLWPGNLKTDPMYNIGGGAGDHNSGTPSESHPPMKSLATS